MAIDTINHFDISGIKDFGVRVLENILWAGREIKTFFCDTLGSKISTIWNNTLAPGLSYCYGESSKIATNAYTKLQETPYGLNASLGAAGIGLYALTSDAKGIKGAAAKTVSISMIVFSAVGLYKEYKERTGL